MSPATATATAHPAAQPDELVKVYVWELPVRIAHWLMAGSIVVLSATGIYIGHPFITVPGAAGQSFVMGWVKVIHGYVAYVFIAALVMRFIWLFTGNNYSHWDKFVLVHQARRRGFWPIVAFYSFLRHTPPAYVGHNPVAASAYLMVYGLCAIIALTGLVLRGASADVTSPIHAFASLAPLFGGLQMARWIHHIVMWLLLGFTVHHVYSAVLMATIDADGTLDSIVCGNKWVHKSHLGPGPYRWDNHGTFDE